MQVSRILPPLLVLLLASTAPAADWTRFRGPNGTGVSDDRDVPLPWTDDHVLFRIKLPGVGHSSPIVVKNRLLYQAATKSDRLLVCHDAETGKEQWTALVPGSVGKIQNPKGSLASSTPCSDGEHVFAVFWDGKRVLLHAYTLEGKLVWKHDLGPFTSQHGPGFSPVVVDGRVFVNNDQDGAANLLAFDARTGKPLWEVERRAFRACYSTPFILEEPNGKQLLVTSTAGVTAYNPANGKELWTYAWSFSRMPLRTVASCIVSDGHIFCCAGDGSGDRNMIAVKLGGKGDVTRTNLTWSRDRARATPYVPSLVAYQGHLYGVLDEGQAFCLEAVSGKEVWKSRLAANVSASPLLINGAVLVTSEKGEVFTFSPTPAGLKVVSRNRLDDTILATPAVANGRLYFRGETHLIAIGKKK
ncbi:MAG: PQQ-binding-like beta-propeller repeat protein [Gemmataceae bacterium]